MEEISKELISKYKVVPLEELVEKIGIENIAKINFYQFFLENTDYLAMKLAEGLINKEDKAEEFEARQFARDEINRLQSEVK